ncbi:uncharacterized protein LOC129584231 [Paramacrobiotus metropolitanus]|uniref:uncharacterized protein LOC129584231 n=1 Tax=Paramacrobiotus metropolitanus TaxID=2943436 RepID=UPI00244621EC|nr:uncharacterized protein LOC129584231 [Paramacrobiotus metropolitanus]
MDSWIKSGKGWRHSTTVVYRRYPTIAKRDALFHVEAGATFNQVLWNMIQLARAHYGTALPPADRRKKLILLAGTNDVKNFWYGKRLSTTHHHKPASDIISQLNAVKNALQHYYSPIFVVQVPETEINRPHCNIAIGYINESLRKFCVEGENARNNWHFINMPAFELGNVADHKDKFLHTDNVHIAPAMGDRLYIAMYRAIERVAQKRTAELQARKRRSVRQRRSSEWRSGSSGAEGGRRASCPGKEGKGRAGSAGAEGCG